VKTTPLFDTSAANKPYQVKYRYQGEIYATVVNAIDEEQARAQFRRENPHVEIVTGQHGDEA
jgi:RNase P/RNase MRP subunit p30